MLPASSASTVRATQIQAWAARTEERYWGIAGRVARVGRTGPGTKREAGEGTWSVEPLGLGQSVLRACVAVGCACAATYESVF